MILFSIIALEKFAQTTENKITVQKRLKEITLHHARQNFKEANNLGAVSKDIAHAQSNSIPETTGTSILLCTKH